jgi:hypothetical protein
MQKKKKNVRGWWEKFDIESNAINLGFAIQSTLTRFTLFYVCIYAKSANVSFISILVGINLAVSASRGADIHNTNLLHTYSNTPAGAR